jgi:hypothetical protein
MMIKVDTFPHGIYVAQGHQQFFEIATIRQQ